MSNNIGLICALQHQGILREVLLPLDTQALHLKQSLLPVLVAQGVVNEQFIADACASFFGLPYLNLFSIDLTTVPWHLIDIHFMKQDWILPIKQQQDCLDISICDPRSFAMIESIAFQTNLKIKLYIARFDHQLKIINRFISKKLYRSFLIENGEAMRGEKSDVHVIDLVDQILSDAIHQEASDIHFEPDTYFFNIRLRKDGFLYTALQLPLEWKDTITSRLKIMSNLDIAEHRKPQDGRFSFHSALRLARDCRLSICPTFHGEKIVVRILETQAQLLTISQLGMAPEQQALFFQILAQPQGLILVTGPTGSGKSITLYAALQYLHNGTRNIVTVENPVEIQMSGINQVDINHEIGLDFPLALRAILRQDPDIIMIGEIRDEETARIAIHAAQTGHLVLATLHTNNAFEAIIRLQNLNIQNHNLISCLKLTIAQRLLRKICQYCYQSPSSQTCLHCSQGYAGRIGVYELLPMTEKIRELMIRNQGSVFIEKELEKQNWQNLKLSANNLVKVGITTITEVERVLGVQ